MVAWGKRQGTLLFISGIKINDKYDLQNEIMENYNQISMVYQLKNEVKIAENFALKSLEIINKTTPVVNIYFNVS